jgi:hypothetical protein
LCNCNATATRVGYKIEAVGGKKVDMKIDVMESAFNVIATQLTSMSLHNTEESGIIDLKIGPGPTTGPPIRVHAGGVMINEKAPYVNLNRPEALYVGAPDNGGFPATNTTVLIENDLVASLVLQAQCATGASWVTWRETDLCIGKDQAHWTAGSRGRECITSYAF